MGPFDFDLDGDGRTSIAEDYLNYRVFEDCTRDTDADDDDLELELSDSDSEDDWRLECYDIDSPVDPDLYDTFQEYKEALAEARAANADDDEFMYDSDAFMDDSDNFIEEDGLTLTVSVEFPEYDEPEEIDESDYPNRRRYNAACVLAKEYIVNSDDDYNKDMTAKCRFIIENSGSIIAANYFEYMRGFLYAQAIKENFLVPCTLPDEDEKPEIDFCDIIRKIARIDVPLSLEIWAWCLDKFIPYSRFDEYSSYQLTTQVINKIGDFANAAEYRSALVYYMNDNKTFCEILMLSADEPASRTDKLIVTAINEEQYDLAVSIFSLYIANVGDRWKLINSLIKNTISECMNYKELETIEFFKEHLLPIAKEIPLGMVQDEMEEWEAEIDSYMLSVEKSCSQYRFTRSNAWRCTVPDGSRLRMNPENYATEQEYMETYRERLELERQREKAQMEWRKDDFDSEVYTYCGIMLPFSNRPYSYRTDDASIKIGDTVVVPFGIDETETEGKVVSVGQYLAVGAPYPIEKTKKIIRKISEEQV